MGKGDCLVLIASRQSLACQAKNKLGDRHVKLAFIESAVDGQTRQIHCDQK